MCETVHLYSGWHKAFYMAKSGWMIVFPAESVHKALLIGACQLSKFFLTREGLFVALAWATSAHMVHCEFEHRKRATLACTCDVGQLVQLDLQEWRIMMNESIRSYMVSWGKHT